MREDVIAYNPANPMFGRFNFTTVVTHELAHRMDVKMFVESWENEAFTAAIQAARPIIGESPDIFVKYTDENDDDGFLSDILSALCEDSIRFRAYHERKYWNRAGNKEMEIFANLFSLECFQDEEKLKFLRKYFPEVIQVYDNMKP